MCGFCVCVCVSAERPAGEEKRWETVGQQFTEIFIKFPDNVGVVLGLLDEYSFRVRWPAVKLLSNLVINKYARNVGVAPHCSRRP